MSLTPQEIDVAFKRLGASQNAEPLRDLLLAELQRVSGPGLSDGALRHAEGRRSFAADLIAKLGFATGPNDDRTDADRTADVHAARRHGAGRRVPVDAPKPERGRRG